MKNTIILLTLMISISCNSQESKSKETHVINTDKIDLADTAYFKVVQDYINTVGTIKKENASSRANQEQMITYHFVYVDSMEVLIDQSNRIYINYNNKNYGNLLKENSTVKTEIKNGTPDTNPQLTKEKEIKILEIYKKLINLALSK